MGIRFHFTQGFLSRPWALVSSPDNRDPTAMRLQGGPGLMVVDFSPIPA